MATESASVYHLCNASDIVAQAYKGTTTREAAQSVEFRPPPQEVLANLVEQPRGLATKAPESN